MALIAHWPLNGNLDDISGNNRPLTSPSGDLTSVPGKIGLGYTKTSGYYLTDLNTTDELPENLTISMWVRHNGDVWSSGEAFFGTRTGSNGFMLYRNGGETAGQYRVYYWYNNTSGSIVIYNAYPYLTGISPDVWYHITMVRFADGRLKLYKNGLIIEDETPPGDFSSWNNNGATLSFHSQGSGSGYTGGSHTYNDIRVYDEALSDKQVYLLSQAKIAHYTCNVNEEPTENFVGTNGFESGWSGYSNGNDGTFITEFGTVGYQVIRRTNWKGI